jgi:hypothetical protein
MAISYEEQTYEMINNRGREMEKTLYALFTVSTVLVLLTLLLIFFSTQKSFLIQLMMLI